MENHYNLFLTVNISGEIIETAKLSSKQVVYIKNLIILEISRGQLFKTIFFSPICLQNFAIRQNR